VLTASRLTDAGRGRRARLCDNVVHIAGVCMTTLTIRLDPKLEKALERIARSSGRSKSDIAREALRRQVAVARFRELRKKVLPFAEAQGLVTDEDVFRALS
jgi:predicted transcriptional regulator